MKDLCIIFVTVFLLILAASTLSVSAGEIESEDDLGSLFIRRSDDTHDMLREGAKERLKQSKAKDTKKSHHLPIKTQSRTAQKGKSIPKPVTPVKIASSTPAVTASVTKSSTVNYSTPEGSVSVGFSVTAKAGIITEASSTTKAGGTSRYYQDAFAPKIASAVVRKKITRLSLSAVGGASLTTGAFERFVANSF